MFYLFLLFTTFFSWGSDQSRNLYEKSFPRDNTFCTFKNKRVKFQIRSQAKYTEPTDLAYGEYVYYQVEKQLPVLLDINKSGSDTFRLFLGTGSLCSKSFGYLIDSKTIAVLFLKENRPYKDKLIIQLLDAATMSPKEYLETNYLVNEVEKHHGGFSFRTFSEEFESDSGKVVINNETFLFHQTHFPVWISYTSKGFKVANDLTYSKSSWTDFFKNIEDFQNLTGWDSKKEIYSKRFIYLATNHKSKRQCIYFSDKKVALTGSESWLCHAM